MTVSWQVKPVLIEQIQMAAQNDEKYQKLMEETWDGKKPEFTMNDNGLLLYQGRMCVLNDVELRQIIMKEAHDSPFAMHPSGTKMYRTVKEH